MNVVTRQDQRKISNNASNPNQNMCALRVAQHLGVADKVRYLHTIHDLKRAAAHRFSVRSRATALGVKRGRKATVGSMRRHCEAQGAIAFIVQVPGHVLLLNGYGKTIIDADKRKRDSRPVLGVWGVFPKEAK